MNILRMAFRVDYFGVSCFTPRQQHYKWRLGHIARLKGLVQFGDFAHKSPQIPSSASLLKLLKRYGCKHSPQIGILAYSPGGIEWSG